MSQPTPRHSQRENAPARDGGPRPTADRAGNGQVTAGLAMSSEAKLRAMVDMGVPYVAACRAAGMRVTEAEKLVPRHTPNRPVSEDEEQRRIVRDVIASGGKVWSTSQKRPSKVSLGIPDLWITLPAHRCAAPRCDGMGLWWETKRSDEARTPTMGRSEEQLQFAHWCVQTGTPYGCGTHEMFRNWCASMRITLEEVGR